MSYEDKTLTCQDCGQPVANHVMKRFTNEPMSCALCRQVRRSKRDGGKSQDQRDMYPWYTPIVVNTSQSGFSPMVTARATAATASANGARPWGWAGSGQQ